MRRKALIVCLFIFLNLFQAYHASGVHASETGSSAAAPASASITHPVDFKGIIRFALRSSDRTASLTLSADAMRERTRYLKDLSVVEAVDLVRGTMNSMSGITGQPAYELDMFFMGQLYNIDKDEDYAVKIVRMVYEMSLHIERLVAKTEAAPHAVTEYNDNKFPKFVAFAYDQVYHSPYWDEYSAELGVDVREAAEDAFRKVFRHAVDFAPTHNWDNRDPYWIKDLVAAAMLLNDPEMIRDIIGMMDSFAKPMLWMADGNWREDAFSYGQQTAGNLAESIMVLDSFNDPPGYEDERFNLTLPVEGGLMVRWPVFSEMLRLFTIAFHPDGTFMAINDTHPTLIPDSELGRRPISDKYLGNYENYHSGLFALKYGNTDDAQQTRLKFQRITQGMPYMAGHYHGDFLGLTLWSGGMELLPDGGYVAITTANRYIHMDSILHNVSWIHSAYLKNSGYAAVTDRYARPALLAYDNGMTSGKQVQLIEASMLMPEEQEIDIHRRAVLMIATDKNHSYTVDIQRLKGGISHENYLRQVEEEDVDFETNLHLTQIEGNIATAFNSLGLNEGLAVRLPSTLTSPKIAVTDGAYEFSWTGKKTGAALKAFIKGNSNTAVAFSQFPTMRRVKNVTAEKDMYPGYHMTQHIDVSSDDITIFGSVYEGIRAGDEGFVKSVEWVAPADHDPMTAMVKVDIGKAVDYIYISNDNKVREFEDIAFSGSYAVVRIYKVCGKPTFRYIFGGGSVTLGEKTMHGYRDHSYKVLSADGSFKGLDKPNVLSLKGTLPHGAAGSWGYASFGDGSGLGYKISGVNGSTVMLEDDPAFEMTDTGVRMTYFPLMVNRDTKKTSLVGTLDSSVFMPLEIEGDVYFTVKRAKFLKN